jgi:hypothetical protein
VPAIVPSFVEPLREDVLDSMNPHCNIRRRQTRDLANGCRIHVFEIRDDDLAIERFEPLNQGREPVQIYAPVNGGRTLGLVREHFELFQAYESRKDTVLTNYIGGRDVVSNAVDPRSQGTAAIVPLKTPPQLKMNVLAQVAALFRVSFVSPREPFE